jgi:serine/threonine protein kinase
MTTYELARELGTRAVPTYAAHVSAPGGRRTLVVVEILGRSEHTTDSQANRIVREARDASALRHPNLSRVLDVQVNEDEILVASEFVDGELLSALWASPTTAPALSLSLRILLDAATGLTALHGAIDATRKQPLKLFHGELGAGAIVVGLDGIAHVIRAARIRQPGRPPIAPGFGSIAPEILSGSPADSRADVYSFGTLLWEALSGTRLFDDKPPESILAHVGAGEIHRARVPGDSPWAAPLADVAQKAMAGAPDSRYVDLASLSQEIRRIAGAHVADAEQVRAFVRKVAGAKIAARRAVLDANDGFESHPPRQVSAAPRPPLQPPARPPSAHAPPPPPRAPKPPLPTLAEALRTSEVEIDLEEVVSQRVVPTGVAFAAGTLPAADNPADAIDLSDDIELAPASSGPTPPVAPLYSADSHEAPTVPFFDKRAATFEMKAAPPPPRRAAPPPTPPLPDADVTPFASSVFESLPPMRTTLATEPSIVMQTRASRRRMIFVGLAVVAVGIGGAVGWRITEGAPAEKPIPVAAERPAPPPLPSATTPPPATATATVTSMDEETPTGTSSTRSSAPAVVAGPPTPTWTAQPAATAVPTSTSTSWSTATQAPTFAPPPTAAPTATKRLPPPPSNFDPTRI